MRYRLKSKSTEEVISVVDDRKFGLQEAKSYFVRVKKLDEKDFDKLFTVDEVDILERNSKILEGSNDEYLELLTTRQTVNYNTKHRRGLTTSFS